MNSYGSAVGCLLSSTNFAARLVHLLQGILAIASNKICFISISFSFPHFLVSVYVLREKIFHCCSQRVTNDYLYATLYSMTTMSCRNQWSSTSRLLENEFSSRGLLVWNVFTSWNQSPTWLGSTFRSMILCCFMNLVLNLERFFLDSSEDHMVEALLILNTTPEIR